MSKAFSLAGIRVGWIATRIKTVVETCAQARDYTTISVSRAIATLALSKNIVKRIVHRNLELVKTNAALLNRYIMSIFPAGPARYVVPRGGTTAFIQLLDPKIGEAVDDVQLCTELMEREKLLVMPGSFVFRAWKGFQGIHEGYCCATKELDGGLAVLARYLWTKWGMEKEDAEVAVTDVAVDVA